MPRTWVVETADAEDLGLEDRSGPQELYFYEPAGQTSHPAVRPDLPLRTTTSDVVDEEAWKEE